MVPTLPVISGQEEWKRITETIEHIILPQLDVNPRLSLLTPEAFTQSQEETMETVAKHRVPIPLRHLVAYIGFLLRGQAVVLVGKGTKGSKSPCRSLRA